VLVVLAVGDGEPYLMQEGGPRQEIAVPFVVESFQPVG
jgi:hypothetical protein